MARKERYLVGLDVGTSRVTAVVGERLDDGALDVVGIGVAESRGIKRGVVVNLEAAVESIKKAVEEAELMAGIEIDSVHLAVSNQHIKGFNSRGVVAVAGRNREISREDVKRAIEAAGQVALPAGREILHVLPQDFVVDEQDGTFQSNNVGTGLNIAAPWVEQAIYDALSGKIPKHVVNPEVVDRWLKKFGGKSLLAGKAA